MQTADQIIHEQIGLTVNAGKNTPMDKGECKRCMEAYIKQAQAPTEPAEGWSCEIKKCCENFNGICTHSCETRKDYINNKCTTRQKHFASGWTLATMELPREKGEKGITVKSSDYVLAFDGDYIGVAWRTYDNWETGDAELNINNIIYWRSLPAPPHHKGANYAKS